MPKIESCTATSKRSWIGSWIGRCIAACALTLTACALPIAPLPERAALPANLTALCPRLSPLDDGSGATVLRKLVEVSEAYYDCADKHEGLSKAVQ